MYFRNSINRIGYAAFYGCTALTNITMGYNINMVGMQAFQGCTNLSYVNYLGDLRQWSVINFGSPTANPLYYTHCLHIDSVEVTRLDIPGGYAYIGDCAFVNCDNIAYANIPSSVTSIGMYAFANCTGLTSIRSTATPAPVVLAHAFDSVPDSIPVYIPCGSLVYYDTAWSYFTNFSEDDWYYLNVTTSDSAQGLVEILTQPTCTEPTAVVEAYPNEGYEFYYWSNGSSANPYTFTVTGHTNLVAYFLSSAGIDGIAADNVKVYAQGGDIVVEGADGMLVKVYDMTGRLLPLGHHSYPCGVYMVKVGNLPARRVVVVR